MDIFIRGRQAVLKKGSTFDFVSENRLFSGADDYTLNIVFPLRGCPQNQEIFGRLDLMNVEPGESGLVFDCEIISRGFHRSGSVVITSVEDADIKAQFLEGRSEQNFDATFDDIYINELDLLPEGMEGISHDTDTLNRVEFDPETGLPARTRLAWVNDSSGVLQNGIDPDYHGGFRISEAALANGFSYQPYLCWVIDRICKAVGYEIDLSRFRTDPKLMMLLVCNALPAAWEIGDFARALPHWTVAEFFEKLETFLCCEFDINHREKTIKMEFSDDVTAALPEVTLENVIDDFSADISVIDPECDYTTYRKMRYSFDDSDATSSYSCPWLIRHAAAGALKVREWSTVRDMTEGLRGWTHTILREWTGTDHEGGMLHHVADGDLYFMLRPVGYENGTSAYGKELPDLPPAGTPIVFQSILMPVNPFGGASEEEEDTVELDFLPVTIDWTDMQHGLAMFLSPSGYSEGEVAEGEEDREHLVSLGFYDRNTNLPSGMAQSALKAGSSSDRPEYYSKIYLGHWNGVIQAENPLQCPSIFPVEIRPDLDRSYEGSRNLVWKWTARRGDIYDFRIASERRTKGLHQVTADRRYTISFLSDTIPNVRSVFNIKGKRYLCEKITAAFSETGMSRKLKGEFWPLADDANGSGG